MEPDQASPLASHVVRELRQERGETLEQFGRLIGLSKGKVSELERGISPCSLQVALLIETLSGGRIDAADLNDDVKVARHGLAAIEPEPEARIILCGECGLRTDDPHVALCQAVDCPRAEREAA